MYVYIYRHNIVDMYIYIYILDILVDKTVPLKPIRDRSPPQARPVARETSARAGAVGNCVLQGGNIKPMLNLEVIRTKGQKEY